MIPYQDRFLGELYAALKPGGKYLLIEPKIHVTSERYKASVERAQKVGFVVSDEPKIRLSWVTLFGKSWEGGIKFPPSN